MNFSIEKYMGRWYQQYSIPSWFDVPGSYNVRADYKLLANGKVSVLNTCETNDKVIYIEGVADVVGPYALRVDFGYRTPEDANYLIALGRRGSDYQASIVTDHDETSLFVITRNQVLSPSEEYALLREIDKRWDLTNVVRTLQVPSS